MSLKLYLDMHVPFAVRDGLRLRGVDVLTCQEDGTDTMSDPDLLDRAMSLGRVIFTQDEDFLIEAARRQQQGIAFAGVLYGAQMGVTIGQCVQDLELIAKVCEPVDLANQVWYLPLP